MSLLIELQVTGFTDLAPVVREETVKAVLCVVPKLSDRIINGELLRHLAKTANDEQPGIRTNTTICLGKIARNLGANVRELDKRLLLLPLTFHRTAPKSFPLLLHDRSETPSYMRETPRYWLYPLPSTSSAKKTVPGNYCL